MSHNTQKTQALFERAKSVMPWGVSSNFRYWGDETPVIARGKGAYVWDADGNRYLDYRLAFGPIILGHADQRVNERVAQAMANGTLFAHTHPLEIEVAERLIHLCPGVEKVRFANSGTEATMHALRIARAHTGREKVVKFEGSYHGFHDYLLFSTATSPLGALGSRRSPLSAPNTSGIPAVLRDLVINVPFNDGETLERVVKAKWGDLAAIIVEPIAGNIGALMPEKGFLELIRRLCDEHGIVMIMDEVKTGFRIAKGGATEYFGVKGDLMAYAKSIANGYPLAAIGGSNAVMGTIEPGRVAQGGTYCGNGVGTAAAAATLEILETTDALEQINKRGQRLMQGIGEVLTEAGIAHSVHGVPAMFSFFLDPKETVRDYRGVLQTDHGRYERLAMAMRAHGVEYEPDPREPWFLSAAHSDQDVDDTLNALNDAVKTIK
ncbi:MAG TPA: guanitoxin biosynthesis PLP-dependent transaminase GntE [Anaerolineales bacterium]|nr:guanitoxin biosynthesis PLP-dependent transaminase GntE [Anaerolineales bacterium]